MRVIKEGKKPEITCEITCKYCETVFEVLPQDVRKKGYGDFCQHFVKCPTCEHDLEISCEKTSTGKTVANEEKFNGFCK